MALNLDSGGWANQVINYMYTALIKIVVEDSAVNRNFIFSQAVFGYGKLTPLVKDHFLFVAGGGSLLKTKQLEDQGFEVIKEVPGSAMGAPRMGNPFAFANPNLTSMAALLAGGSMGNMGNMSSLLAGMAQGSSLMNQSNMLQKCEYTRHTYKDFCCVLIH